ncbi:Type 1 glutamine amidotransferase-like domain-containing protein [Paenibacillus xylanexedens]|uniref:Type 1 glutamine amidotransferase-like domain-containing protein n=1 Tax=Paenibacillus xylanexedens TaxID=528191 RepID=UPI0011A0CC04|nr:Type 1 glutamine amidotransferase-like domain-containing protein [Paenibacillus xylanexedens]
MGRIVAIGGGEMRFHETLPIDRYIVEFSNIENPKLLFIPTASNDAQGYIDTVKAVYGEQLGCEVDTLCLFDQDISDETIKNKILSSNIIYVGGGDTVKMMEIWRTKKVDQYLKKAFAHNIVLSGLSAGSICWFLEGHSNSSIEANRDGWWDREQVIGFGLIPANHCPHYNEDGHETFDDNMLDKEVPGIALENNVAIVIDGDMYKIVKSNTENKAYVLKKCNGKMNKIELNNRDFKPLSDIL